MKIVIAHNYYQQRGGEASVFEAECTLLENHGHQIIPYTKDNHQINEISSKISLALNTHWSTQSYKELKTIIEKEKPDIAHFHNTFPLISPSAYYACQEMGVPVVQTLHNYRLMCPAAIFLRNGNICEDCMGKNFAFPGILHKCYRDSRVQTAISASTVLFHRIIRTWHNQIDRFIALTEFAANKFIEGGIPAEKLAIKPNFIDNQNIVQTEPSDYCIFIGRLSPEKGINQLIQVWKNFPDQKLKIIGSGPLENELKKLVRDYQLDNVEFVGAVKIEEVLKLLSYAQFLILPTQVYETFGRVIIEAYSCGKPVLASQIGAIEELILDGKTGLLFDPTNLEDITSKVEWIITRPEQTRLMGQNARLEYEQKYTPEANYEQLMDIYNFAIQNKKQKPGA